VRVPRIIGWRSVAIAATIGAVVTVGADPASAYGYKDAYYDPQESAVTHVDVHKTTRFIWQGKNGTRYLTVVVWGWDEQQFAGTFGITIDLDTTGDERPDYGIGIDSGEDGALGCGIYAMGGGPDWEGQLVVRPVRATGCRVMYRQITVTKRIGWRVLATDFSVGGGDDDTVPDWGGWIRS
jgi:hypothetical protein